MIRLLLTVFAVVSVGIVQAQSLPEVQQKSTNATSAYDQIPIVSNLINFAKKHLSHRYRSGGTTPKGFDCSGFTRYCFNKFGISLPHSSAAQGDVGESVEQESAQPGDLILFKGHSSHGHRIGHVGMIVEVEGNRIKFIHSAWNGGVRYDWLHASYYQKRYMGIRRVMALLAQK